MTACCNLFFEVRDYPFNLLCNYLCDSNNYQIPTQCDFKSCFGNFFTSPGVKMPLIVQCLCTMSTLKFDCVDYPSRETKGYAVCRCSVQRFMTLLFLSQHIQRLVELDTVGVSIAQQLLFCWRIRTDVQHAGCICIQYLVWNNRLSSYVNKSHLLQTYRHLLYVQ